MCSTLLKLSLKIHYLTNNFNNEILLIMAYVSETTTVGLHKSGKIFTNKMLYH